MKKYTKIGSIFALLLALLLPMASYAVTGFTDIDDSVYKVEIESLFQRGIVKGTQQEVFKPHAILTNAQAMTLMNETFKLNLDLIRFSKEPKATDYFIHANDDAWYAQALIISSVHGVGFLPEVMPNDGIDRETFVSLLVTYAEVKYDLPMIKLIPVEIKDAEAFTPEKEGAIQRALAYGVVSLDAEGNFSPKEIIQRDEAAKIVHDLIQYLESKEFM